MSSKLLDLTPQQVVDRARGCLKDLSRYRLEYPNGGLDPSLDKPWSTIDAGGQNVLVADCIGFALWCSGISRRFLGNTTIPPFPDTPSVLGGYINCSSMVEETLGFPRRKGQAPYVGGRFFKTVDRPVIGDLIVYPGSTVVAGNPKHGHIGVITGVPAEIPNPVMFKVDDWIDTDTRNTPAGLRITHCSSTNYKNRGKAVWETHAVYWRDKSARFVHLNREQLLRGAV